jgi:hypothetical protein
LEGGVSSAEAQQSQPTGFIPPRRGISSCGRAYRDQIRNLKKALANSDEDIRAAADDAIREIVEKVIIHPRGRYTPVKIEIYGQLAALLLMSERAADPKSLRSVGYGYP